MVCTVHCELDTMEMEMVDKTVYKEMDSNHHYYSTKREWVMNDHYFE